MGLLFRFQECLNAQMAIFEELIPVLDKEEELITSFSLKTFENVVFEKDTIVKRAQNVENRRLVMLRRILFLISYDARAGAIPSLRSFMVIFDSYITNVKNLVQESHALQLFHFQRELTSTSESYLNLFERLSPRIFRNQTVLQKAARNMQRSLAVFQSELNIPANYDAHGKQNPRQKINAKSFSSVRVRA